MTFGAGLGTLCDLNPELVDIRLAASAPERNAFDNPCQPPG